MPKVTEEYREARREEIAGAAMRAIRRKGFQAASMADIIDEAGLSAGVIYNHFKSKSEIVMFVATKVVGSRIVDVERLAQADPLPPPAALIRLMMAGMIEEVGRPTLLVQIWGEAVADPDLHALATGVIGRLRATLVRYITHWQQATHGLELADATALAHEQVNLFVGAAQGYILQSALLPDFDGDSYLTAVEKYLPQ
jgi:AcrR family transcriptional regulator